ncbi:MAG: hypothetical protein QGI75_04135 [Phycisphaerales bacterium]|jgi:hypothetical protein|nr:hypothetical protein [Phycisphaerales bacterium]MDP6891254.1 hypothetical protein [Phycisphaerales bacterium]
MLVRSICSLTLLATLSLSGFVLAQVQGGRGSEPVGNNVDLSVRQQALESMNQAAGSKLEDALAHQKLLEDYVKSANLVDVCGSPSSNDQHDMAMSFDQALTIAIDHQQAAPTSDAPTEEATPAKVRAYTELARSTWDRLQTAMGTVQYLSDCLSKQGKLADYNAWENDQAKTHHEAMVAKEKEVAKANQEKHAETQKKIAEQYASWQVAQKKQHEENLKHAWTAYKFNTNANLKAYKYSKQYGPNSYNQTYAGDRYGSGWGYYGGNNRW